MSHMPAFNNPDPTTILTGTGTEDYIAKFDDNDVLADSYLYQEPALNRVTVPKRVYIGVNLNETGNDPALEVQTTGTALTEHDGGIQSFVTSTYNTASGDKQVMAGGFFCDATRASGANDVVNTGVICRASGGQQNQALWALGGTVRIDEDMTCVGPITFGDGTVATGNKTLFHTEIEVDSTLSVSLGNTVQNFIVPGDTSTSPCIAVGGSTTGAAQINTKNTVAANADAGVQVLLDTTVASGIRGGFTAFRGSGGGAGGAVELGLTFAGAADNYIVGATANDACLFNIASGKRILFSSDGSGFTVGAALNSAGLFVASSLMTGNPTAGTGAKWTSGTGSPEGAVTGNKGDLYSRTDGNAGECLYVKESTGGNTGWAPNA